MPTDIEELKEVLAQFRIDVITALSEIDVEINALQEAVREQKPVTHVRLKELRNKSRQIRHKFRDYHAQHIALAHEHRESQQ